MVVTTDLHLRAVRRQDNRLVAELYDDYRGVGLERVIDQVVVEYGTLPADEVYFDLKPRSRNLGQVDLEAMAAERRQDLSLNPEGSFDLFRVGDAVASRNIHAAIYESRRICQHI